MSLGSSSSFRGLTTVLILLISLACVWLVHAQPTIVSIVPQDGATNVPPATTVVFTFSEAMDTDTNVTTVSFVDLSNPLTPIPAYFSWNGASTVLTCTPLPAFPANKTLYWVISGANPNGEPLEDDGFGFFTTGSSGGGTGFGTNAFTTFSLGKIHHYHQTSAALPTLDPATPYGFSGVTSLASNRTATSISLTFPTAAVSNLNQLGPPQAEIYVLFGNETSLTTYDAKYPAGNYTFQVQAVTSNQTALVTLPPTNSLPQPAAPHLSNFAAAQAVDPSQPFVLTWDAFPGGTSADYIDVDIGANFGSPDPGKPGALTGTTVSFTIPAGTLHTNAIYSSQVGFFHWVGTTNGTSAMDAYRATYTEFTLITTGGGLLLLTNAASSPTNFTFDVRCAPGELVTVEYKTNLTTATWQTLLTTNSPGNSFRVIAPQPTHETRFFRARSGPSL
jgi:hypothetical protein